MGDVTQVYNQINKQVMEALKEARLYFVKFNDKECRDFGLFELKENVLAMADENDRQFRELTAERDEARKEKSQSVISEAFTKAELDKAVRLLGEWSKANEFTSYRSRTLIETDILLSELK